MTKYSVISALQGSAHLLSGAACALILSGAARSQEATTTTLEPYVVSPTRFELPPEDVGNAVSAITREELERRQVNRLDEAIRLTPGAIIASSGQTGANSAIFLRGVNSNQTQFVVDGVRINDSNILIAPFLGAARPHHTASLEVLRGPQSALYGGEAIGGVVSLYSPRGEGDPSGEIELSAGSFSTFESVFSADGADGPFAWSLSLGWESTENDRPHNGFNQFFYATRIDYQINEHTSAGLTIRGADRELETPGDIYTNDPDDFHTDTFNLLTSWLEVEANDWWTSRLTAGWLNQDLGFTLSPLPSSGIESDKLLLDWRNTVTSQAGHTTLFGLEYDHTSVTNTGFGSIDDEESRFAIYAQQTLQIGEPLSLTAGTRWEDYDSFCSVWTWRGAGAWTMAQTGTILRSSVGSGFRAPSFFELYARDAFFVGNPDLGPEESIGWDAGIEQPFGQWGTLGLTWFHNSLDDIIVTDFTSSPATVVNLEQAETQGLELSWEGDWRERLHYQLAYTWLDTENEETGESLLRRPEHTLGFHVDTLLLNERLTLGFGGYLVRDRLDVDPRNFATVEGDDYFLARLHGKVHVRENLDVTFRVENLFDQDYQEVLGFPGRGIGAFGGIQLRF